MMKHPEPPIERMLAGQVWLISVIERRRQFNTPLGEAKRRTIKFLLLIIDPLDHGWRANKYRWYQSVFRIGDLQKRTEDDIWDDIHKLQNQSPPYKRNYRPLTKQYRSDNIRWERFVKEGDIL